MLAVAFIIFAVLGFALPIMGLPLHQALASRPHSVTSYSVQLSVDGSNWTDVMCQGQFCVFDCSAAASQRSDNVVRHRFPQTEEGRYLRLRPRTWENKHDGAGADLRMDIMLGSFEEEPSLDFAVMQDGQPGQAWLQAGCNKDGPPGVAWAARAETADAMHAEIQKCVCVCVCVCVCEWCAAEKHEVRGTCLMQ